jgi:hypothetical protein
VTVFRQSLIVVVVSLSAVACAQLGARPSPIGSLVPVPSVAQQSSPSATSPSRSIDAVTTEPAATLEPDPELTNSPFDSRARIYEQAAAALERWAAAVGENGEPGMIFPYGMTGQIGSWEDRVGDNNKSAHQAGMFVAKNGLSAETPPPGDVEWPDGRSETVDLVSAHQALGNLVEQGNDSCSTCEPLRVTGAQLEMATFWTGRGEARVPVWKFSIEGTRVKVTQVAVADFIRVVPPPWDPYDTPAGISIESAVGDPEDTELTISFVGAPRSDGQECGLGYIGEAIETEKALVVLVWYDRPSSGEPSGPILMVGAMCTTRVTLAAPLGDRAVLSVREGMPVPVSPR